VPLKDKLNSKYNNSKTSIATKAIEDVVKSSSSDRVAINDVINAMDSVGFGLVMMIFAFGIIIPTPPPFPSIISTPLVIFSYQMFIGYSSPRLPKRFINLSIKRSVLAMLVQKSSSLIRKIEKFLKPRCIFMTTPLAEKITGFFILLFSSFIVLPMPLSNYIPGLGILIASFGMLSKDGLAIIFGIIIGCLGITISIMALFLGIEFINYIKNFF
jgi:hypothetical protein